MTFSVHIKGPKTVILKSRKIPGFVIDESMSNNSLAVLTREDEDFTSALLDIAKINNGYVVMGELSLSRMTGLIKRVLPKKRISVSAVRVYVDGNPIIRAASLITVRHLSENDKALLKLTL